MRLASAVLTVLIAMMPAAQLTAQQLCAGKDGSIRNVDTRGMVIAGGQIYLATKNELYRAVSGKDTWDPVFSIPSGDNEILCAAALGSEVFVGTRRGLFRTRDSGRSWQNVLRSGNPDRSDILSIDVSAAERSRVTVGLERGVYTSEDGGAGWKDVSGVLSNSRVTSIACRGEALYAGGEGGVFAKDPGAQDWRKICSAQAQPEDAQIEPAEEGVSIETEEDQGPSSACVAVNGPTLYMGCAKKVMSSDDSGNTWKAVPSGGIAGKITCIAVSQRSGTLYCGTTRGVFRFSGKSEKWDHLYRGQDRVFDVRNIVFDPSASSGDVLWAITDKGLYKLDSGAFTDDRYADPERGDKAVNMIFEDEPSFAMLQDAAIRYAELGPEKIANWRTQARLRALMPKLSFGLDNSSSNSYEIYTSATKDYVVTGPEDITKGFDVSVSWELGDIIWSDDQTNIDVRSRLTTQLRNDILDDLRRAYYERKRLQFELITYPPMDPKAHFEKALRVQELTQTVNDLTGNYLDKYQQRLRTTKR